VHDLVQGEAALSVQFRGEADLGIHDPVGREVLGALLGDPGERLPGLHHADRVPERVQVDLQVAAAGAFGQLLGQFRRVTGGQIGVTGFLCQFQHRLRAQAAVQMVVQQDFRNILDLRERQHPISLRCVRSRDPGTVGAAVR